MILCFHILNCEILQLILKVKIKANRNVSTEILTETQMVFAPCIPKVCIVVLFRPLLSYPHV